MFLKLETGNSSIKSSLQKRFLTIRVSRNTTQKQAALIVLTELKFQR